MTTSYLTSIDQEIERLKTRLGELETAKRVLATLEAPSAPKLKLKQLKRTRIMKNPHIPNAHQKARTAALEYLQQQTTPKASREIIKAVSHLKLADSTMWKALKELRDEGVIRWDENTRFYTIVRAEQQVAS